MASFKDPTSLAKAYQTFATWFEGKHDYIYLNKQGQPSIGIGHSINSEKHASQLTLFLPNNRRASYTEIKSAYQSVCNKTDGIAIGPAWYANLSSLRMKTSDINALFNSDALYKAIQLFAVIKDFQTAPNSAQLAMMDFIFNMGPIFTARFKHMLQAVYAKNWAQAAKVSYRHHVSVARNKLVYAWLAHNDLAKKNNAFSITDGINL